MSDQFSCAMLTLAFVATLLVVGQLFVDRNSTRTGGAFAATLDMPALHGSSTKQSYRAEGVLYKSMTQQKAAYRQPR